MAWTAGDPISPAGRRLLVILTLALVVLGTGAVFRQFPKSTIAGERWQVSLNCDLTRDWCPAGWGWGSWRRTQTGLMGEAPADSFAVYFFGRPSPNRRETLPSQPTTIGHSDRLTDYFRHGGDFVMETEVRLLRDAGERPAEVQLLIREGNEVRDETGLALITGQPSVIVRYRAAGVDHLLGPWPLATPVVHDRWYRMAFIARKGHIRVDLDGTRVFDSRRDSLPLPLRAWMDSTGAGALPPGRYIEPHIAVKNGSAEFRNVRLLVIPGDRWALAR